jgi:hypothetical protein
MCVTKQVRNTITLLQTVLPQALTGAVFDEEEPLAVQAAKQVQCALQHGVLRQAAALHVPEAAAAVAARGPCEGLAVAHQLLPALRVVHSHLQRKNTET